MRMKEKKVLLFLALMFLCICSPMRAEARAGGAVLPEAEEALVPEAAVITVRIPTVPAEVPVR